MIPVIQPAPSTKADLGAKQQRRVGGIAVNGGHRKAMGWAFSGPWQYDDMTIHRPVPGSTSNTPATVVDRR